MTSHTIDDQVRLDRTESRCHGAMPARFAVLRTVPTIMAACAMVIFTVTRIVLTAMSAAELSWPNLPYIATRGLWFDIVTTSALVAPFMLIGAALPKPVPPTRMTAAVSRVVIWLFCVFLLFAAFGEVLFWSEFGTRYNFIAVDYLVYTQEVAANIVQSYPITPLLAAVGLAAAVMVWCAKAWIRAADRTPLTVQTRLGMVALGLALPLMTTVADIDQMRGSGNTYADELSGNGLFTIVSAFFINELDYDRFYATIPQKRADGLLSDIDVPRPAGPPVAFAAQEEARDLPPYLLRRPKNVVLITVESLSAAFLGTFGDTHGLTPNLDRIAARGMLFDHAFATGTRTVRGLEATSLGTPPVPGQAIVRRPNSDHLTTLGNLLAHQGYDAYFAYGGNSYFDNMAAYFGGNAYHILDRADFPAPTVPSENAWGAADEAVFTNVERLLARRPDRRKPFLAQIMTTSNHRPFTYPGGRIDIPSPGGRDGAVKYTDYAIGKFLDEAARADWFADTLFVIVADHCDSVAGKVELPVERYHIPILLYGPGIVKPGRSDEIVSQLDLPPTILDALGKSGRSYFFGQSLGEGHGGRAFISNYQSLGYYKDDMLTVLKPKKVVESYRVDPVTLATTPAPVDPALRDEAIAYYQTASHAFSAGELKAPWRNPTP